MKLSLKSHSEDKIINIYNMTEPQTKCSEQGFEHAWENTTPNIVYCTFPASYPDKEETCKNCWLKRFHRQKVENWIEYK